IGRMGRYRLVLTLDFKVLTVAMEGVKKIVPCERRLVDDDYQVLNTYRCNSDVFSLKEIASAAKIACKKEKKFQRKSFPFPYQGVEFDVEGPYLIYPVKKNKYSKNPGPHRVVINLKCHIAGVLTMDSTTKELVDYYIVLKVDLIISWILLFYVVSSHTVLDRREWKENGYDCGDAFFNDPNVHNEIKTALSERRRREHILPYSGLLYSRAMNYVTWPIIPVELQIRPTKQFWRNLMYQIVFDGNGKVVDLIVRLANNQFAKCWRVDSQRSEASIYSVEGSNGYECGSEFIPDDTIEKCTSIARKNLDKGYYYPLRYTGNLYSEKLGLRIWPIYYRNLAIHRYPNTPTGSFFIVIDSTGQLIDVIAKTSRKNYIRCMRARKVPPTTETVELSQMSAKTIKQGYLCHDVFFDEDDLKYASKSAQKMQKTKRPQGFPKPFNGPPFYSPCLLWPINRIGDSFRIGRMDKYRLVLTLDFMVLSVAMEGEDKLVPCESRVIDGDYQVLDSYRCQSDVFSHEEIALAAKMACRKKKQSQRQSFPAPYQGVKFIVEGPYLIYPVRKKKYSNKPGNHRVVINSMCHIAGVLTIDPTTNEL
ncbi:hypothetical protein EPUL_006000, partial [Erysiphe pulchra]